MNPGSLGPAYQDEPYALLHDSDQSGMIEQARLKRRHDVGCHLEDRETKDRGSKKEAELENGSTGEACFEAWLFVGSDEIDVWGF